MSSTGVRTQNPRDFTVQIRRVDDDEIVGTGIVVAAKGQVVTCAHVFEAATGVHPRDAGDAEVGVYFPQVGGAETKERTAKVEACFPSHDDDIVLLQLTGGPAPLGPGQIAVVGKAVPSQGNSFRAYGYRRLDKYLAGWADGTISGCVECPEDGEYLTEPVQLESSQINHGMSGSGVLDTSRNLVIGIVSEVWFPAVSTKDRDTAWAVDSQVLTFAPLLFAMQEEDEPLKDAPTPKTGIEAAVALVVPTPKPKLVNAPSPLDEWVGRVELLEQITADWAEEDTSITGLIGFGGEGKSSLARRWLEELSKDKGLPQPDGVFWWGFYEEPSVDEFLADALDYMGGGQIDMTRYMTDSAKAHLLAAMFSKGRYLFVLDGLEVMQHQEGNQYGLLKSHDLRDFLKYIGGSGHNSFCLITSRVPMLDMMSYTTYRQQDVTRLSEADGCDLLRELGVKADNDEALKKVVSAWDGHALTLGLIGSLVGERYDGDISQASIDKPENLPEPEEGQKKYRGVYNHVHRVLRRYDEHLTEAEQAFMTMFSAFRLPVRPESFERVFRTRTNATSINARIADLEDAEFDDMIRRLLNYRILRYDDSAGHYTAHPIIRKHFEAKLAKFDDAQRADAHGRIEQYYHSVVKRLFVFWYRTRSLDDLEPWIEVIHHLCQAGRYDEADRIRDKRIDQRPRGVLVHALGAYDVALDVYVQFFPENDISEVPCVSNKKDRSWILQRVGYLLKGLGRVRAAAQFFDRANELDVGILDPSTASQGYQNLADIHACLGNLAKSENAATTGLKLAEKALDHLEELQSRASLAWIAHLYGSSSKALAHFQFIDHRKSESRHILRHSDGIKAFRYASYLRRIGDVKLARDVTMYEYNLRNKQPHPGDLSQYRWTFGDIDADEGKHESARDHYADALKNARRHGSRDTLIEALLARGRWWAKNKKRPDEAFSDLNEALEYAVDGEYRIYEADTRIVLGWAHFRNGDKDTARAEVDRAMQMSKDMGYHWGKVDGQELLDAMDA